MIVFFLGGGGGLYVLTSKRPCLIVLDRNYTYLLLTCEFQIAYLKNGKVIFEEDVEELKRMNPNKSTDIIIKNMYINKITRLNVSNHYRKILKYLYQSIFLLV